MKAIAAILSLVTISSTVFAAPMKYNCGKSSGREITLKIRSNAPGNFPFRAEFVTSAVDDITGMIIPSKLFKMEGALEDKKTEDGNGLTKVYVFHDIKNIRHLLVLDIDQTGGKVLSGHELYLKDDLSGIARPEKEVLCKLIK